MATWGRASILPVHFYSTSREAKLLPAAYTVQPYVFGLYAHYYWFQHH